MVNNKKIVQDPVEAERKALQKEIAKHKKAIGNVETVLQQRKQLELLKSEEKKQKFLMQHPKVASAGRKLKALLGATSKGISKATEKYKEYNRKHPPKKITFGEK